MTSISILNGLHPFLNDFLPVSASIYGGMLGQIDLYTLFIALHAIGGILSFVSGSLFLAKSTARNHRRLFELYFWSLIGMVAFLVAAMTVWWTEYTNIEQMIYPGLLALAFYMLYRGNTARSSAFTDKTTPGYFHDVGFTLIALFEGFIIVFLININAPMGVTIVIAILGVILGREAITRAQDTVINSWSIA